MARTKIEPWGELWRIAIQSATIPSGKIATEIGKRNKVAALTHVPELREGLLAIRSISEKHMGQEKEKVSSEKTNSELLRLGDVVHGWLLGICEEFSLSPM